MARRRAVAQSATGRTRCGELGSAMARRQVSRIAGLPLAIYPQMVNSAPLNRAVAQLGSALEWGSRGPGFESRRPDIIPRKSMAMFYVYVLRSETTRHRYVGSCADVDERVRRHNAGHSKSTRHGVPWMLIHSEGFSTRAEAVRKERYYKSGSRRDEVEHLSL